MVDPTSDQHAATKKYVDDELVAAGGASVQRFTGDTNGSTGPGGGYTWAECALITADNIETDAAVTLDWESGEEDAHTTYYVIQTECSDGTCDADLRIGTGVFICGN